MLRRVSKILMFMFLGVGWRRRCPRGAVVLVALWTFMPAATQQAFGGYEIFDLSTAEGPGISSGATGINDAGQVVGWQIGASPNAFLWDHGSYTDLGLFRPSAINNHTQIIGLTAGSGHAFLWQNGLQFDLGSMGYSMATAQAINDRGDVVGLAFNTNQPSHAFIYHNGSMAEILVPTASSVQAYGINNARQVVGSYAGATLMRAFVWQDGALTDLIGVYGEADGSVAWGINNLGRAVGVSWLNSSGVGVSRPTLWRSGQAIDLGTLGGSEGQAKAINDRGQIVGYASPIGGGHHAFLWQNGVMTDLNDLLPQNSGWTLQEAYDINESGWIAGSGYYNGCTRAFLLTPEPATLILMAMGGSLVVRRRPRRAE